MIHYNYVPNIQIDHHSHHHGDSNGQAEIIALKHEVERLSIVCEALWQIVSEKHDLEEIDLIEKMTQIDMADGRLDGRKQKTEPPRDCPRCKRTLITKRPKCLYCGEVVLPKPF